MKARVMVAGTLLLTAGFAAGSAQVSVAAETSASAAKKRCKKGYKRVGRRCRKKKPAPIVIPPAGSKERATLVWNNPIDVDLHIWDAAGNHSGYKTDANGVLTFENQIVNGLRNADVKVGPGPETFTDTSFIDSPLAATNRLFTIGICPLTYYDEHQKAIPIPPTVAAINFVRADTSVGTVVQALDQPGQGFVVNRPSGGFGPTGNWCS